MGVPLTPADLRKALTEQVSFLKRSVDSYDSGFVDEAKRLAVTIRILVHDTGMSHSLLSQLDLKKRLFLDAAAPTDPDNLLPQAGLVIATMSLAGAAYLPILDDPDPPYQPRQVPFDDWWDRIVIRNQSQTLSRKQLVLTVANQDGGAHVDPTLDTFYASLSRGAGMGMVFESPEQRYVVMGAELASIRQIAHELIKSIEPSYTKARQFPAGGILIGPAVAKTGAPAGAEGHRLESTQRRLPAQRTIPKVGRNDPCPCGSGQKYKRCHGR